MLFGSYVIVVSVVTSLCVWIALRPKKPPPPPPPPAPPDQVVYTYTTPGGRIIRANAPRGKGPPPFGTGWRMEELELEEDEDATSAASEELWVADDEASGAALAL